MNDTPLIPPPPPASESENDLPVNPHDLPKAPADLVLQQIMVMLGGLGTARPDDGENYILNLTGVLTEYPVPVVLFVTNPRTGIQARAKYVPRLAEIKAACEARMTSLFRIFDSEMIPHHRRAQIEEQERAAAERKNRPTYDGMLKRYGKEGWWDIGNEDSLSKRLRIEREDRDRKAHIQFVSREYELHGLVPVTWKGVAITLSLAKQMEALGKLKIETKR